MGQLPAAICGTHVAQCCHSGGSNSSGMKKQMDLDESGLCCDGGPDTSAGSDSTAFPASEKMSGSDGEQEPSEVDDLLVVQASLSESRCYFDRDMLELKGLSIEGSAESSKFMKYRFRSGAVYVGQWERDMRHGFGTHTWPDGASYEGQWDQNVASGRGRFTHTDGDVYIGEWSDNTASGLGVYRHNGGDKYYGEWRHDLHDGYGVERKVAGPWYTGMFEKGQKHGLGCHSWADGSKYEGSWRDNVLSGPGAYTASNGVSFKGQWRHSDAHGLSRHGLGRSTWPDGRVYEGGYAEDQKHGFGIFKWPHGEKRYEGFWRNGKQSGSGRTTMDGVVHLRKWERGRIVRPTLEVIDDTSTETGQYLSRLASSSNGHRNKNADSREHRQESADALRSIARSLTPHIEG